MQSASGPSAVSATGPKPVAQSEAVREKRDLASWWKNFVRADRRGQDQAPLQGIFGVPLQVSILYANVAISLFNEDGQSYVYGYVPIIVAKCGVFLKEKATDVEGIFRLAGSEKRIKDLKVAFDSPDRYGKGLDWTGFTVHDAANILRRYFNQLPEPIIPLNFYEDFRAPLRNHQAKAVGAQNAPNSDESRIDVDVAIRAYQSLITRLPPLNRQLLLYILDLLAVFASKSDLNKMTTPNLAAIFQPGILSHPQHDMAPQEYRLSQDVLIFLIENQDSFLIGMQGTAADPETVREVQSGPTSKPATPPTPNRSKTVGRSESNSSAAAESIRRFGSIRRNLSVSSKTSKRSEVGPTPVVSAPGTPPTTTGSVHRSNTMPSRRGPGAAQSPRFNQDRTVEQVAAGATIPNGTVGVSNAPAIATTVPVAATTGPATFTSAQASTSTAQGAPRPLPTSPGPVMGAFTEATPSDVKSTTSSEATARVAVVPGSETSSVGTREYQTPKKDTTPLLGAQTGTGEKSFERTSPNLSAPASGRKGFLDILKQSPTSDGENGRRPNKLQKKRIPGSSLSSAQSSSHSLPDGASDVPERSPVSPDLGPLNPPMEKIVEQSPYPSMHHTPVAPSPQRNPTDATLRPTISPAHSYHSQTDVSDADLVGDDMPAQATDETDKPKRRSRWRFSRSQNKMETAPTSSNPLGTMNTRELATSRSTIGSGGSYSRPSFQEPTPIALVASTTASTTDPSTPSHPFQPSTTTTVSASTADQQVFSDSERERSKGPMSWLRGKIQDRRDKDTVTDRRSMTPDRSHERSHSKHDSQVLPNSPPPPLTRSPVKAGDESAVAEAARHPGLTLPAPASGLPVSVGSEPASASASASVPAPAPTAATATASVSSPPDSSSTAPVHPSSAPDAFIAPATTVAAAPPSSALQTSATHEASGL